MPLLPSDAAALPRIVRELEAVVAEIREATDESGPGGRKILAGEWAAIVRRLLVAIGDLVQVVVL